MPRLIDADKLKECFPDDTFKNRMVKVIIDRQPTVEVEVKDDTRKSKRSIAGAD